MRRARNSRPASIPIVSYSCGTAKFASRGPVPEGRRRIARPFMPVDIREFYPPNPTNVPPQLTRPTQSYRIRAALVVASLFLFVLVYLGLIVGFGGFSVWAFLTLLDMENFREFQGGGAAGLIALLSFSGLSSGLLALYFIKGLFKFPKGGDDKALEITEADQPRLFAFIRQVCADTGAPPPAKIVLSPEVGASVFFPCPFWNLF